MLSQSCPQLFSCRPIAIFCLAVVITIFCIDLRAQNLVIRSAYVISGTHPKVSTPQDIVIENGLITFIGKFAGKADHELDAKNQYLIPGLIDTHVHLEGVPGTTEETPLRLIEEATAQIPRNYLYFGFTTLLDLISHKDFIGRWNRQDLAPQAFYCAPVTIPNSYPLAWVDEQEQFYLPAARYLLFDEAQADEYPAGFQRSQHTPSAVIKRIKKDGAHCVKIFYETGFGRNKNLPVPTIKLAKILTKQAHNAGLQVFLHGNSQAAYEFAVASGVDVLVHGMWHWEDMQLEQPKKINAFAKSIAAKHISVQPSIQVIYGEQELFNPDFFDDPRTSNTIPKVLITWYQSEPGQWMHYEIAKSFSGQYDDGPQLRTLIQQAYIKPLQQVNFMSKAIAQEHGNIIFGSDTPSGPFYTQYPGLNGRLEMDRWIEAGFSLRELFTGMTIRNAEILKMETAIGSVEVGKQADLVLLQQNPLEDVRAYDSIITVIVDGKAIARKDLSAYQPDPTP